MCATQVLASVEPPGKQLGRCKGSTGRKQQHTTCTCTTQLTSEPPAHLDRGAAGARRRQRPAGWAENNTADKQQKSSSIGVLWGRAVAGSGWLAGQKTTQLTSERRPAHLDRGAARARRRWQRPAGGPALRPKAADPGCRRDLGRLLNDGLIVWLFDVVCLGNGNITRRIC